MGNLRLVGLSFAFVSAAVLNQVALAEDLFLAAGSELPGKLWLSEGGTMPRTIHVRQGQADPAYPYAVMKSAQVAVTAENKLYFCSGLDGYIMHLLDGRHEIAPLEVDGQVRDIATTGENTVIYYSVVPTPQNGAALVDGVIYRRNLEEGAPTVVATIRQSDVGHAWWGTFTIRDGMVYIATLEPRSRIFTVAGDTVQPAFQTSGHRIQGLSGSGDGTFYYVTGDGAVYRTVDFTTAEPVLTSPRRFTDVTLRAIEGSPRP